MDRYNIALGKSPLIEEGEQLYAGWIRANVADPLTLRDLGVTGEMLLTKNNSAYEHCIITKDVGLALKERFGKKIFLKAFTAIDSEGNCLPKDKQFFHTYLKEEEISHG